MSTLTITGFAGSFSTPSRSDCADREFVGGKVAPVLASHSLPEPASRPASLLQAF